MSKKITVDEVMNKLLYVPFNDDYKVEEYIKKQLTEEEFFRRCFVGPEIDDEIERLIKGNESEDGENESNVEVEDFEINLEKEELARRMHRQREELAALRTWMSGRQAHIYCVRGDAGTGKTTFLHYLKYYYRNEPIYWNIVDIQNATDELSVLDCRISIPEFHTLYAKATSALLINLSNAVFPKDINRRYLVSESANVTARLVKNYKEKYDGYFPREEIHNFFSGLCVSGDSAENTCRKNAKHIKVWVEDILKTQSLHDAFPIFLELYVYFVICIGNMEHHIIALDNFERFIGVDEIYNGQLTEFVTQLRSTQRSIYANNHLPFQLIIFMRNTSVRMFASEQAHELFPHTLDISSWFDASRVLKKKLEWYATNKIDIEGAGILLTIINDMGVCGDTLRGLHFKISMLFNYNKRLVILFLLDVIVFSMNEGYIRKYLYYWNECESLQPSLNKFAARSIMFRLILNSLRRDGFFIHIIEQSGVSGSDGSAFSGTGCARKILSILYEHYMLNPNTVDLTYMELDVLVSKLYVSDGDPMERLLDDSNSEKLDMIAQVLFYMNYYDGRHDNWLQFVDIQYNHTDNKNVIMRDHTTLREYIRNHHESIKVRITNAGIAYMYYVVSSFEFFACKSITKKHHSTYFGKIDIPPLLCSVPTEDEIRNSDISELTCVKTITVVLKEAQQCIEGLNNSANPVPFRVKQNGIPKSHQERIVNAHRGFIDNFMECLEHLYKKQCQEDAKFECKFRELRREIEKKRDQYVVDFGIHSEEDKK